jgi:hypothetical protein
MRLFTVPPNAKHISYKYNFLSEEPPEWLNTKYNDQFEIYVINQKGEKFILETGDIDHSEWHALEGDTFQGGDKTASQTGWKTMTHEIAEESRGEGIRLIFHVWDVGDSLYDSALLLDEIKILESIE